jgi:hypothetical protein
VVKPLLAYKRSWVGERLPLGVSQFLEIARTYIFDMQTNPEPSLYYLVCPPQEIILLCLNHPLTTQGQVSGN